MRIAIFRTAHFNAAHRLHVAQWSDARNIEEFGICNNPHYHGHNYELEVKIVGETDPVSGILINLSTLAGLIESEIVQHFDHKNLNIEVHEFRELNPSVENICYVIWQRLRKVLPDNLELTVRLYETPRNYAEYPA